MPLFPQEQDASQRMFWTREGGTRRLVLAFLGLLLAWFILDRVHDHFLLEQRWKPLSADFSGLTVVGTLDSRGSYDRNMFKVVQANKEFRVELTDFGWRSIFDPKNGPMFTEEAGNAIKSAIDLDDLTGSAMFEPYLASGVAHLQGKPDWNRKVDLNMPIVIEGVQPGSTVNRGTLGGLIAKYIKRGGGDRQDAARSDGEGSGTTHEVEHGTTLPADTLAKVCPVVLTGAQFNSVYVEESPASLVGGRTWIVHLGLTAEGRSRFYQWSHDHINENLIFVLNHEVMAAGRVTETLDVNEWGLGPLHDEVTVRKLEAYVKTRAK